MSIKSKYAKVFLQRLYNMKKWGRNHTSEQKLLKLIQWLPPKEHHLAKKVYKQLLKNAIILVKPTKYGKEISLNTKKKKEIQQLL